MSLEILNKDVVTPKTLAAIQRQPVRVQQTFDRWASGDPKKVQSLERSGTLLRELRAAAEMDSQALEQMSGQEYSHLTDREKLEIAGPPQLP